MVKISHLGRGFGWDRWRVTSRWASQEVIIIITIMVIIIDFLIGWRIERSILRINDDWYEARWIINLISPSYFSRHYRWSAQRSLLRSRNITLWRWEIHEHMEEFMQRKTCIIIWGGTIHEITSRIIWKKYWRDHCRLWVGTHERVSLYIQPPYEWWNHKGNNPKKFWCIES